MQGLIGGYRITRELPSERGEQWFEAEHVVLPRSAIVRVAADAGSLLREARGLEAIGHAGVPRVYDCGVHEGITWVAIERVTGEPISRGEQLSITQLTAVLLGAARILAQAHVRGIAHGNLSPHVILYCYDARGFPLCLTEWRPSRGNAADDIFALGTVAAGILQRPVPAGHLTTLVDRMLDDDPKARPSATDIIAVLSGNRDPLVQRVDLDASTDLIGRDDFDVDTDSVLVEEIMLEIDPSTDAAPRNRIRWTPAEGIEQTPIPDDEPGETTKSRRD